MLAFAIGRFRLRHWARRYRQRLGMQLRRDYGVSQHYTEGQIRTAASKCRLSERYLFFGFAAFMPEAAFRATVGKDLAAHYAQLRALLGRYAEPVHETAWEPAAANPYVMQGGDHLSSGGDQGGGSGPTQ